MHTMVEFQNLCNDRFFQELNRHRGQPKPFFTEFCFPGLPICMGKKKMMNAVLFGPKQIRVFFQTTSEEVAFIFLFFIFLRSSF